MLKIKDNFDLKELEKYGFEILETHSSDYYFKRIKRKAIEIIALWLNQ